MNRGSGYWSLLQYQSLMLIWMYSVLKLDSGMNLFSPVGSTTLSSMMLHMMEICIGTTEVMLSLMIPLMMIKLFSLMDLKLYSHGLTLGSIVVNVLGYAKDFCGACGWNMQLLAVMTII